jgi:putative ABC transport system permease protein
VRALGLTVVPAGWMLQTPAALTAAQIDAARQAVLASGGTVETKSGQLGLIRSETAADLRTLTATGASARTRRALTGVTAGVLALLGAVLGTAVACLAGIAWAHSSLTTTFGGVSPLVFLLLLAGMPLVAAVAGWLLGGREPAAFARQPLE